MKKSKIIINECEIWKIISQLLIVVAIMKFKKIKHINNSCSNIRDENILIDKNNNIMIGEYFVNFNKLHLSFF
jgi:hypothetical protein